MGQHPIYPRMAVPQLRGIPEKESWVTCGLNGVDHSKDGGKPGHGSAKTAFMPLEKQKKERRFIFPAAEAGSVNRSPKITYSMPVMIFTFT